jgi:hypothetical protein
MGKVQELLVAGLKVFSDRRGIVGGEREKFFDLGPVDQVSRTDDFNPKGNGEIRSGTF